MISYLRVDEQESYRRIYNLPSTARFSIYDLEKDKTVTFSFSIDGCPLSFLFLL